MARAKATIVAVPSDGDEEMTDDRFCPADDIVGRHAEARQHTSKFIDVTTPTLTTLVGRTHHRLAPRMARDK